jgi:hypothetical protein
LHYTNLSLKSFVTHIDLVFLQDLQGHTFYYYRWQIFDCCQMLVLLVPSCYSCSLLFVIMAPFLLYYCWCRLHVKVDYFIIIFKSSLHIYCYLFCSSFVLEFVLCLLLNLCKMNSHKLVLLVFFIHMTLYKHTKNYFVMKQSSIMPL